MTKLINNNGFYRLPTILSMLGGISKSLFYSKVQSGEWPKPVRLSERVSVWRKNDIHELILKIEMQNSVEVQND